jgi:hypothetical protein
MTSEGENGLAPVAQLAEATGLNPVQCGFNPRRGYWPPTIDEMAFRSEEDPDEEPDEPGQPNHPGDGAAISTQLVPSVGLPLREWEFSTQVLTVAQLVDGVTLVKLLKEAGADGWDLTDVIDGGEKRVLLMRRPKRSARESRRVGFAPPKTN